MDNQRCAWSNKKSNDLIEVKIESTNIFDPQSKYIILKVLPKHANRAKAFILFTKRYWWLFITLVALGFTTVVAGELLYNNLILYLGLLIFGVTLLFFPLATPTTVSLIGMRGSIFFVRLVGCVLLILSISELLKIL